MKEEHSHGSPELVLFPGQKMPATPEGRGTVLTMWVSKGKVVDQKRSVTGAFLIKAPTSGTVQLHDGRKVLRQKRLTGVRTSEKSKWILSGNIGGSDDTTQESPAKDPSLSICYRLPTYNIPRHLHSQRTAFRSAFGDACTRAVMLAHVC